MRISKLRPFVPAPSLIVPTAGDNGKHYCLLHYSENETLLDAFRNLDIKPAQVKHVMVPTTKKPITRLTPNIKKAFLNHKVLTHKLEFGAYEKYTDINYYIDYSFAMKAAIDKWSFIRFNTGKPSKYVQGLANTALGISNETHDRVLLYTVNLDKKIPTKIFNKRIYPIYELLKNDEFPFDSWICYYYNSEGGQYIKIWDKDWKIPLARVLNFLKKVKSSNLSDHEFEQKEEIANLVGSEFIANSDELKSAVKTYVDMDADLRGKDVSDIDATDLTAKAVAYHIVGDIDKAKAIVNKSTNAQKKNIIRKHTKSILPRSQAVSTATNSIVKMSNIPKLIDNEVPTHILEKRKRDFDEYIHEDLENAFKMLGSKKVPLELQSVERKVVTTKVNELEKSISDDYTIKLKDIKGKIQKVNITLPHLTENGTFMVNGNQRVLVNQIVSYPIAFFKPYHGQLSTIYSSLRIHSKQVKKGDYLMCFVGGYKLPLVLLLVYKLGLQEVGRLFDVDYKVHDEKPDLDIPPDEGFILKTPNRWIEIRTSNQAGLQLAHGLRYIINSWPLIDEGKIVPIGTEKSTAFWRKAMVDFTGTRNCIYVLDEVWKNIITPIEEEVLESHGDPTELDKIILYISQEVINGRVDDRNSLEKQRIRTSEVFTALIMKQINAAYNEYLGKLLGGDENATYEINSKKTYSEVIQSQNVQLLENVNPCEEISMMTRVTPVGIGGIPDKRAVSQKAMSTHHTYLGNIDPLETPDGPSVGILQHLTVGASIINKRGQFATKTSDSLKPSEILSMGPAMIPFVESCDGNRVLMAAGQLKQAITLSNPETPAVQTGYESVLPDMLSDNFIKKAPVNGEITFISNNLIKIKDVKGKVHTISISPVLLNSGQGKNGISVFKPNVKIGAKVKKGQHIADGGAIKDGQVCIGVNMLIALMPWKGYNFEDGIVISESGAKKFTSVHIDEAKIYITEEDDIVTMCTEGQSFGKGDIALTYTPAVGDTESYRHLRLEGGVIAKIEVISNLDVIPEKLIPAYELTKKRFMALHNEYPQGTFKEKGELIEGILIKIIIQQEEKLKKGDKLNNRHFNKGVVAIIEKDENMPLTPWGERIEMCLNPISIINRMINSQPLEVHCGLISWKLGQVMMKKSRPQFMAIYTKVAKLLDGTVSKTYSKDMIQKFKSLSDTAYAKVVADIKSSRFFPIIVPPFQTPDREDILKAMAALDLEPRYHLDIPGHGKTDEKVTVGYFYKTKLEHMSEKKMATRSVGSYVSKTMAPTQGKKSGGGQKMGEHDIYSLLSWDCPHMIEEFFGPLSSDHTTKNELIAEVIQTGKCNFKTAKSNPVKDLLSQNLLAIHLKSK